MSGGAPPFTSCPLVVVMTHSFVPPSPVTSSTVIAFPSYFVASGSLTPVAAAVFTGTTSPPGEGSPVPPATYGFEGGFVIGVHGGVVKLCPTLLYGVDPVCSRLGLSLTIGNLP